MDTGADVQVHLVIREIQNKIPMRFNFTFIS